MRFNSNLEFLTDVEIPQFTGIRVMMMPFYLHDVRASLPDQIAPWFDALEKICIWTSGIGYLTVDEAFVRKGETHRRSGLHVDSVGPDGEHGGWGGGGSWGSTGFRMVSSHVGCQGWDQLFLGSPGANGDCSHLEQQLDPSCQIIMQPGEVWDCGHMLVHESIPHKTDVYRQFVRVSMPSNAPWYEGYTRNPKGIEPTGPIHPARTEFMGYRP